MKATNPQARAPAKAEAIAARQAMFENGNNLMKTHVYKVHTGYPGA
jgi:hypothetical protein